MGGLGCLRDLTGHFSRVNAAQRGWGLGGGVVVVVHMLNIECGVTLEQRTITVERSHVLNCISMCVQVLLTADLCQDI